MSLAAWNEDRRLELAAAASRTQRANQPRHLVLLAAACLAGALLYLLISWQAYSTAQTRLAAQQRLAGDVRDSAARLKALQAAAASGQANAGFDPSDTILSRLQRIGQDAGLKNAVGVPAGGKPIRPAGSTNAARTTWTYTLKDPSAGALLEFARRAADAIPGLEVYGLRLRPEAQGWELQVTFARWERVEEKPRPEGT